MLPTPSYISNFIEKQFPEFYREQGEDFVAFVKSYYEWLETQKSRDLFSTRDIDLTSAEFVEYFRTKYMAGIPQEIIGNKRFLQKHILDLYRSKGSAEGIKLLFRLLYNEEVNIYQPASDILRASDGRWTQKEYIEVTENIEVNKKYDQKFINGVNSKATAFVDSYQRLFINNKVVNVFYLTNITGNFEVGERIYVTLEDIPTAPVILGSVNSINVTGSSSNQFLGDVVTTTDTSGRIGLKALVSNTYSITSGSIDFKVINGGSGYTANAIISITPGTNSTGSGATFVSYTLKNTSSFAYTDKLIGYAPFDGLPQYFNANTDVTGGTTRFIKIANNKFANGDYVRYIVAAGNTAITGLTNGNFYYVASANSTGIKLANLYGGVVIAITKGQTQNGHSFTGRSILNTPLNAPTYGSYLNNANLNTILVNAFPTLYATIGTIDRLLGINPGTGYNGNVTVKIIDTLTKGYGISDGNGNVLGNNAVIYGDIIFGQGKVGSVKVKDSGVGYNVPNEQIILYNTSTGGSVNGTVNLGAIGFSEGYWEGTRGMLDMDKYIEDNNYYQEYSYETQLSKSIDKYLSIIKDVMHPVGNKIFGKTNLLVSDTSRISIVETSVKKL